MICDLLDVFRSSSDGDTMALDSYIPQNGLYFRLYQAEKEIEELLINKNTPRSGKLYHWFKTVDYYSRLIEMNKPVDPKKKIHSNNIYSIFFKHGEKYDAFISQNELSPLFKESIIRYYDTLANPTRESRELLVASGLPDIDMNILRRNKEEILSLAAELVEKVLSYEFKSSIYIKIFFDAQIER
ncbi:MAG: hypothetical protein MJA31_07540, partial [Clostridia bacterium]|nr:hypothetical protein [Clostridia bacterium]